MAKKHSITGIICMSQPLRPDDMAFSVCIVVCVVFQGNYSAIEYIVRSVILALLPAALTDRVV